MLGPGNNRRNCRLAAGQHGRMGSGASPGRPFLAQPVPTPRPRGDPARKIALSMATRPSRTICCLKSWRTCPRHSADCLLQTSLFDRLCASLIDAIQAEDGVRLSGDDFVRAHPARQSLSSSRSTTQGTWFRSPSFLPVLAACPAGPAIFGC